MSYTFRIILRPEPEGGYTVLVPALPGCVTFGETIEEAHTMGKEAIEAYVESMKEHGEAIPDDTKTIDARIQIAVA